MVGPRAGAFACFVLLALAACGTDERAGDAAAVAERFHAALESGDGRAACADLSAETASKLERQEKKPCEEAILGLGLPRGGTVAAMRVEMRSAYAGLSEGSADFLDEGPEGWRISAAGCREITPERPFECELEG